jgi:site-specific DNA recombinase
MGIFRSNKVNPKRCPECSGVGIVTYLQSPEARYAVLDAQYAKEQNALSEEIKELQAAINGFKKSRKSADKFIALIDKYENYDTLTTTMLNEFVEKILVHERDRKGSIDTTQEVEIFFNFVGKYVPPHFGELTPEEQEVIRKREVLRDRLHQNYLRRKANGKVAEDYEKTKAAKKAKMDAKKNALRGEDIVRGVFVPVSHLPKREPKIAERTA